ncbi:MAG TPA: class I tRNA ligase family protein, partial [Chloroflexota bacterium]|nr:class I tRNA ligase family protein [Chloroflexota bacterium]
TLDTFVDSSWYFLRFCSPHDATRPWDPDRLAYWAPVDQYTGGAEHATLHLLYARFVVKALRDLGWLTFGEPFVRLYNQGLVISAGAKMSKSRGNVVNPEAIVNTLGADTVRAYLMFLGPWNLGGEWSDRGIRGIQRFLVRVWRLVLETKDREAATGSDPVGERAIERLTHRTIARVTDDLERFRFNTQVATLMEYERELGARAESAVVGTPIWREAIRTLLLLLAPSTPYLAEELWFRLGLPYSIHHQPWPVHRPEVMAPEEVTVLVQVNGKVRDRLALPMALDPAEVERRARSSARVRRFIDGHQVTHVVYIPDTLINLVTD